MVTTALRDDLLRGMWLELMNGEGKLAMPYAKGYLAAFYELALLNQLEWEGWMERFNHCPEEGVHSGGRAWCAYCGNIPAPLEEEA